jgi:uncharacterized protein (TIGR00251 family)
VEDRIECYLPGGRLKVRIKAPPVDGRANEHLISYLGAALGLKKSQLTLQSGQRSRDKRLGISGIDQAELDRRVQAILDR